MAAAIRAFIAIEIPEAVRPDLERVQAGLKGPFIRASWVSPKNIHLTLKFLGDIPPDSAAALNERMAEAGRGISPLSLFASGVGAFPGPRRPRVLWVGLGGDLDRLERLHRGLEAEMGRAGFPPEGRPFRAHLTVARVKAVEDPAALEEALRRLSGFRSPPFSAVEMVLFRSELTPSGPIYTRLYRAGLGGAA